MAPRYVLNVAEKPSVAKELARILAVYGNSTVRTRDGRSVFNRILEFECPVSGSGQSHMAMTSLTGHMKDHDFDLPHRPWHSCSPSALFTAPIISFVPPDKEPIAATLKELAAKADMLILWLDCDREGEDIAYEVIDTVKGVRPDIAIRRARFSALIPADIINAVKVLGLPQPRLADAVRARREIDLRLGAAFTRLQTLCLAPRFDELSAMTLSYGPCQFPTLGFIVDRYRLVEAFNPSNFWIINMTVEQGGAGAAPPAAELEGETLDDEEEEEREGGGGPQQRRNRFKAEPGAQFEAVAPSHGARLQFTWARGRLYDRITALVLYERAVEAGEATVVSARGSSDCRRRPIPMNTIELSTAASRLLGMQSDKVMAWAEWLYTEGFLSYPRTETESFKEGTDLPSLIAMHEGHPLWGAHATLLRGGGYLWPSEGPRNDNAHPPIHPLRAATAGDFAGKPDGASLWRLYELVARHFLACCSRNATGQKTNVEVEMGGERFNASGTIVTDRGWLAVYPYSRWGGGTIPSFSPGDKFVPTALLFHTGTTRPPDLLTEAELIDAMDKEGIGTDATVAQHIKTVQDRQYARREGGGTKFSPTTLGVALLAGYDLLDIQLGKPWLRAKIEKACDEIAAGRASPEAVIASTLAEVRPLFDTLLERMEEVAGVMAPFFSPVGALPRPGAGPSAGGTAWSVIVHAMSRCGACGQPLQLRRKLSPEGKPIFALFCTACNAGWPMARYATAVVGSTHICPLCGYGVVSVTRTTVAGEAETGPVCPKCRFKPPAQYNGAASERGMAGMAAMECRNCLAHAQCTLAKGVKRMVVGSVAERQEVSVRPCGAGGTCPGLMQLGRTQAGQWKIACDAGGGKPTGCRNVIWLPKAFTGARLSALGPCKTCSIPVAAITVRRLDFIAPPSSVPSSMLRPGTDGYNLSACCMCDEGLIGLGVAARVQVSTAQLRAAAQAIAGRGAPAAAQAPPAVPRAALGRVAPLPSPSPAAITDEEMALLARMEEEEEGGVVMLPSAPRPSSAAVLWGGIQGGGGAPLPRTAVANVTNGVSLTAAGIPICDHHGLVCDKKLSKEGRPFFKCPQDVGSGACGFFMMADAPLAVPYRQRGGSGTPAGAGAGTMVCFKCNQPGHFAAACPGGGRGSGGPGPSAGGGGASSPGACFKCGLTGHFAAACKAGTGAGDGGGKRPREGVVEPAKRAPPTCSTCGSLGHTKRGCKAGNGT
jgi:DNA topoisomerase-3